MPEPTPIMAYLLREGELAAVDAVAVAEEAPRR
jgi:hypothetical protein